MKKLFLLLCISALTLSATTISKDSIDIKALQQTVKKQDSLINTMQSRLQDNSVTSLNNHIVLYTTFVGIFLTIAGVLLGYVTPKEMKKSFNKLIEDQSKEFERQNNLLIAKNKELEERITNFNSKIDVFENKLKETNNETKQQSINQLKQIKNIGYGAERKILLLDRNARLESKDNVSIFLNSIKIIIYEIHLYKKLDKKTSNLPLINSCLEKITTLKDEYKNSIIENIKILNKIRNNLDNDKDIRGITMLIEKTINHFNINIDPDKN